MTRLCGEDGAIRIVDLCTGCGCVALLLAHMFKGATVLGCDIDAICVRLAKRNQTKVLPAGETDRVSFVQRDVMSAADIDPLVSDATVVVANPPYIDEADDRHISLSARRWEPRKALTATDRGDAVINRILDAAQASRSVRLLAIEVAGAQQAKRVARRAECVWAHTILKDSAGVDRCVVLSRKSGPTSNGDGAGATAL